MHLYHKIFTAHCITCSAKIALIIFLLSKFPLFRMGITASRNWFSGSVFVPHNQVESSSDSHPDTFGCCLGIQMAYLPYNDWCRKLPAATLKLFCALTFNELGSCRTGGQNVFVVTKFHANICFRSN